MLLKRSFLCSLLLALVGAFAPSVMGSSLFSPSAANTTLANHGGLITVTAPNVQTSTGMNIFVNIAATDTTGLGATGFDARIQFDPAVVTFQGCSLTGTIFSSSNVFCNLFPTPDTIAINVNGISAAAGAGSILRLSFQVIGTQGQSSPLNFVSFMFNEGDPASVTNNGSISLLPVTSAGVSVSGRLLTSSGRAVSRGTVSLSDGLGNVRRIQTNTLGYFRFDEVAVGETYVLSATARGYSFQARTLNVMDQISDVEIVAEP